MGKMTKGQWRSFMKRAATIHRKSEALFADAMSCLGVEDDLTDEIDNILVATADTLSHLDRRLALSSEQEGRQ